MRSNVLMFLAAWRNQTEQAYSIIGHTIHLYVTDLTIPEQLNKQWRRKLRDLEALAVTYLQ